MIPCRPQKPQTQSRACQRLAQGRTLGQHALGRPKTDLHGVRSGAVFSPLLRRVVRRVFACRRVRNSDAGCKAIALAGELRAGHCRDRYGRNAIITGLIESGLGACDNGIASRQDNPGGCRRYRSCGRCWRRRDRFGVRCLGDCRRKNEIGYNCERNGKSIHRMLRLPVPKCNTICTGSDPTSCDKTGQEQDTRTIREPPGSRWLTRVPVVRPLASRGALWEAQQNAADRCLVLQAKDFLNCRRVMHVTEPRVTIVRARISPPNGSSR
jgi:hypothetical protein